MTRHAIISPEEAADRLAIRELIEAYAHCADRREAKGQMALFTPDTPQSVRRDHAPPWTNDDPVTERRPRHRRNLLHAPSPHG